MCGQGDPYLCRVRVCWGGFLRACALGSRLLFSQVSHLLEGTWAHLRAWGWRGTFLQCFCQSHLLAVGRDGGRRDLGVVTRWRWPAGCLTAPFLSAGEAFLGSFVASGMGPSASSHGSPVPLPSDLSFRSPTPSNLPMVQLWAAHAHEGKERARRVGRGLPGRWLSPAFLRSAHSPPQSPLPLRLVGPSHVTDARSSDAQCSLSSPAQGLCTSRPRCVQPPALPHWLSPARPSGLSSPSPLLSLSPVTMDLPVFVHEMCVFLPKGAPRAGPGLFSRCLPGTQSAL